MQKVYKAKFEKEKGKSIYNQMIVPPDVKHAMDVAKSQSNVSVAAVWKSCCNFWTVWTVWIVFFLSIHRFLTRRTLKPACTTLLWPTVPTSGRPLRLLNSSVM